MSPDQPDAPLLSVIIPNWNTAALVEHCIQCIRANTPDSFEIIVVDNGSTDGSRDVLESLKDAAMQIIPLPTNQGFAAACNHGLRAAKGEYLCLLNTDAFVGPGWSRKLIACIARTGAGMTGPWTNSAKGLQRRKWKHRLVPPFLRRRRQVGFLSFFCVVLTREVFTRVGLLDEQFGMGSWEDVDYCRRAIEQGFRLVIEPRCWVRHQAHSTMLSNNLDERQLRTKGAEIFEAKWGKGSAQKRSSRT